MAIETAERIYVLAAIKRRRKSYQEWEDHKAEWQRYAIDMAKQGFRPEYCVHGRRMWTDHDINCGYCEFDDDDTTWLEEMKLAISEGRRNYRHLTQKFDRIMSAFEIMDETGIPESVKHETAQHFRDWMKTEQRKMLDV